MKGLAFIGGEAPSAEKCASLAAEADIIAAADSGLITAENAKIVPDWIIGDMDSLDDIARLEKYPADRVLRFPHDKDFTDTELAFDLLIRQGCDDITLAGGGGGRLDHILALAALFERTPCPARWFTAHESIFLAEKPLTLKLRLNTPVSVFPLGQAPWKVESSGLKWKLNDVPWKKGSFGISNATEKKDILITPLTGRFLIIVAPWAPQAPFTTNTLTN
jgi:thiamine pyrophosphokinase